MVGGYVTGLYSVGGEHAEAAVAASVTVFFGAGMAQFKPANVLLGVAGATK